MEQIKIIEKYYLDGETLQERYEIICQALFFILLQLIALHSKR